MRGNRCALCDADAHAARVVLLGYCPFHAVNGAGLGAGAPTSIVISVCCASGIVRGSPANRLPFTQTVILSPRCTSSFASDARVRDERLAPHRKKLPERKRAHDRRLDVNDSVGRMRVQPIEALPENRPADRIRNRECAAVIVDRRCEWIWYAVPSILSQRIPATGSPCGMSAFAQHGASNANSVAPSAIVSRDIFQRVYCLAICSIISRAEVRAESGAITSASPPHPSDHRTISSGSATA